jgi:hypothetical protein
MAPFVFSEHGTRPLRVYLSGPITKGNRTHNFAMAAEAQRLLMLADYAVWNPMLTMLHPDGWNIPHEVWLATDLAWVEAADVLIRLPGASDGADQETAHAKRLGIPVLPPENFECLHGMFPPAEKIAA